MSALVHKRDHEPVFCVVITVEEFCELIPAICNARNLASTSVEHMNRSVIHYQKRVTEAVDEPKRKRLGNTATPTRKQLWPVLAMLINEVVVDVHANDA